MSELEYQPTLTTPKSSSSTEPDELSSDLHHIRTTLVSMFAFLTDRPPTHINLVLDDCHRGKESFTGKFEHRLRTTVFLLSPDGKGVEAVLARFVYEKRDDNLKRTLCELQWGALDKVVSSSMLEDGDGDVWMDIGGVGMG